MNKQKRHCGLWLVPLALALVSGAPRGDPQHLVRQGNAAYARGDYETAQAYYTQAEDRITDPGLVAFNQAAALYRQGRFREAAAYYRRCREDAAGPRLPCVLYNLGNCLLQQANGQSAEALREAIGLYQECLSLAGADPALRADARHNLELAKLLLLRVPAPASQTNPDGPEPEDPRPRPEDSWDDPLRRDRRGQPAWRDPRGDPLTQAEPGDLRHGPAGKAKQPPPGAGNLPPIPDEDELVWLSPEDAAAHVQQAAARIARERREHHQRSVVPAPPQVKNW
jgi:tetratricopeptide (TPR) repeat protein